MTTAYKTIAKINIEISKRKGYALLGLIMFLVNTMLALACGWSYITDHSVRFNSYRTGRGFYRLPPLPIMYDDKTGKELSVQDLYPTDTDDEDQGDSISSISGSTQADDVWSNARSAVRCAASRGSKGVVSGLFNNDRLTDDRGRSRTATAPKFSIRHFGCDDGLGTRFEGHGRSKNTSKRDCYMTMTWRTLTSWSKNHTTILTCATIGHIWGLRSYFHREMYKDASKAFEIIPAKYPRSEKNEVRTLHDRQDPPGNDQGK